MSKVLITNPAHDDITKYLHAWSKPIKDLAEEKCQKVKELVFEQVTRKNVESCITKMQPKLVIFHGHGNQDVICGFGKNEVLVKAGVNDDFFGGRIVHSVTCSSASVLGDRCVESGALAFIGFSDEVHCPYDPRMVSNPTKDKTAAATMEPIMQVSRSLLKNNTAREAYDKSQDAFMKSLELCHSSEAPYELDGVAPFIFWNMSNQTVKGDETATLF